MEEQPAMKCCNFGEIFAIYFRESYCTVSSHGCICEPLFWNLGIFAVRLSKDGACRPATRGASEEEEKEEEEYADPACSILREPNSVGQVRRRRRKRRSKRR